MVKLRGDTGEQGDTQAHISKPPSFTYPGRQRANYTPVSFSQYILQEEDTLSETLRTNVTVVFYFSDNMTKYGFPANTE